LKRLTDITTVVVESIRNRGRLHIVGVLDDVNLTEETNKHLFLSSIAKIGKVWVWGMRCCENWNGGELVGDQNLEIDKPGIVVSFHTQHLWAGVLPFHVCMLTIHRV
jgi:hypothetical protein